MSEEADQQRRERLEALGRVATGLAHDANNLLTVIAGNLELARDLLDNDHPASPLIDSAIDASFDGGSIAQEMLRFARKSKRSARTVDANEVLASMRSMMSQTMLAHVDIAMTSREARCAVVADAQQLGAAVLNLVINARDALPHGGQIHLVTDVVEFTDRTLPRADREPGFYGMIEISDRGRGMSRDEVARAREPFYSTKAADQGSGLGLSMADQFAERSGGWLSISSAQGNGTRVRVFIPAGNATDLPPPRAHLQLERDEVAGSERVLLAEFDFRLRRLLKLYLTDLGYHVLEAVDGETANAIFDCEGEIDGVITSMHIRGSEDNDAFVETVAASCRRLPMIILHDEEASVDHREMGDRVVVIRKPFRFAVVVASLRRLFDEPQGRDG